MYDIFMTLLLLLEWAGKLALAMFVTVMWLAIALLVLEEIRELWRTFVKSRQDDTFYDDGDI